MTIHSITIKHHKISKKEVVFNLWINGSHICKSEPMDEMDFYEFLVILRNGYVISSNKQKDINKVLKIINEGE